MVKCAGSGFWSSLHAMAYGQVLFFVACPACLFLVLACSVYLLLLQDLLHHCSMVPASISLIKFLQVVLSCLVCMSLVCIGGPVSGSVCVLEVLAKLVFLACLLACNCCSVLILLTCFLPCFLACRKCPDHKWPKKWSDLMTQVCWPACCFALLGLIKSPLSLALCASWSAWFDQEISLSLYVYIYICLYLCWLQDWCKVDGTEESRSAGLHVLGQLQVLHCVPCCLCLVKSACVETCVLLSSSGLSLCVYIYIIGAGSAPSSCRMVQS